MVVGWNTTHDNLSASNIHHRFLFLFGSGSGLTAWSGLFYSLVSDPYCIVFSPFLFFHIGLPSSLSLLHYHLL